MIALFVGVATYSFAQIETVYPDRLSLSEIDSTLTTFTKKSPPRERVDLVLYAIQNDSLGLERLYRLRACLHEIHVWQIQAMPEAVFINYCIMSLGIETKIQDSLEKLRKPRK